MSLEIENPFEVMGVSEAAALIEPIAASTHYRRETVRDALVAMIGAQISLIVAESVIRKCSPSDALKSHVTGQYQTGSLALSLRTLCNPAPALKQQMAQLAAVKNLLNSPGLPRNRAQRRQRVK